jgi:ABC-type Zn uptake system ZnuABC Zn-binding protein ZnuA
MNLKRWWTGIVVLAALALLAGCGGGAAGGPTPAAQEEQGAADVLALPELTAVFLNGRPLRVVATTSIIGDVVAQVGGDLIELTTLMAAGQDPHSYEPGAGELTAVADADLLFLNGWDLEESLVNTLQSIGADIPVVPVSVGISPLAMGADEEHGQHGGADSHVWLDVANVRAWTATIADVLSALDPANAEAYAANAAAYDAELAELDAFIKAEVATIPAERRLLVTNHESLNYFARAYGFGTVGTVIPAASTLAEPSARDLAGLVEVMRERDMCTIFSETTVSDALAQTIAAELAGCDVVGVRPLYTGALGLPGSGADSYLGLMRANVGEIVAGLNG